MPPLRRPKRRSFRPVLLAALVLAGAAPASARTQGNDDGGDTILPGYWSYRTRALLVYDKTERRCLKRQEIERVMSGAINRHYTCTYPAREQSFGRVSMKGVCVDKKGRRVSVAMNGAYTPTTLDMTVHLVGIPIKVEGRRISETCP